MPPKTKRLPPPTLLHLKQSRQLLEDFLYQYLPQLTSLGAISRINIFTWFSGKWGLTPDASGGLPYMVLEALRLQRQHLLTQKSTIKPLSLTLFGSPGDGLLPKALPLLQELNNQSHTAKVSHYLLAWKDVVKELQAQLQRQPAAERNLLILDPMDLPVPNLPELIQLLPKRLDVLMVFPTAAIELAGGVVLKKQPPETVLALAKAISKLLPTPTEEVVKEEVVTEKTLQQLLPDLKTALERGNRFVMHYSLALPEQELVMYGLSTDALMVEKMLLACQRLRKIALENIQAGNQLGLFGEKTPAAEESPVNTEELELLLSRQDEWDNQALYLALLRLELLPQLALPALQQLIAAGKVEVLDEKKKKLKLPGSLPVNHTAYKLPAPSRYFRLKSQSKPG